MSFTKLSFPNRERRSHAQLFFFFFFAMAFRFGFAAPTQAGDVEEETEQHKDSAGENTGENTGESTGEKRRDRPLTVLNAETLLRSADELVAGKRQLDVIELEGQRLFCALNEKIVEIRIQEEQEREAHAGKESHEEEEIGTLVQQQVDVRQGVYEGGFKVWECTYDLLRYFLLQELRFDNQSVLEVCALV